mmetsp:Transcript_12568/g.18074  ORF Transcript_12568/g.18074 Transcript_12568/m.18074 type:complete len:207 (+) Transcript_12568:138-758(+)
MATSNNLWENSACQGVKGLSISINISIPPPLVAANNDFRLSPDCVMMKHCRNESTSTAKESSNAAAVSQESKNFVCDGDSPSCPQERKKFVREIQSCLILLRHSTQCTSQHCIVASKCGLGKKLANHVSSCTKGKDNCPFPHCGLATFAISHYKNCRKPMQCRICGPVKAKNCSRTHIKKRSLEKVQENSQFECLNVFSETSQVQR